MSTEDPKAMRPTWKNEINLNTIVLLMSIVGFIFAGGIAWQNINNSVDKNTDKISALRDDVDAIKDKSLEFSMYGLRITTLETGATTLAKSQRDLDRAISQVQSDVRVIRQVVEQMSRSALEGTPQK